MSGLSGGVLLEGWCRLLLDGLVAGGSAEVIVSPGSRSTPLVLAAHAHPDLTVDVLVDERAASFYALGRARVTGRPPILVRTSGSAGGHDLPAVIEAREAGWPLVIVTADRPPELVGVRAPQTIDQLRLFGAHAVGFFELGLPDPASLALRAVRRTGLQAARTARGPVPGAVQVNLRARKPLEPGPTASPEDAAFRAEVDRLRRTPGPRAFPPDPAPPSRAGVAALRSALAAARRPLVVAGPSAPRTARDRADVARLVDRHDLPVLFEATSQLRFGPEGRGCHGLDAVLRCPGPRADLAPDLVLQLGDPPIGTGAQMAASAWGAARWVVAPRGYPDPDARAAVIEADVGEAVRVLLDELGPLSAVDPEWRARWRRAERLGARVADAIGYRRGGLSEADVARAARAHTPSAGRLMVGNSLSVRHLDLFVPSGGAPADVLHQRGASGIDGLVAGAIGAARAGPTVLLLGDVSARHDLGGLALADRAGPELTVVVLHNEGGRIFEQLPIARRLPPDDPVLRAFTTPDPRSLVPVASALGWAATRVETSDALDAALAAPASGAPRLVEARVEPDEARTSLASMLDAIASAWGEEGR